LCLQASVDRDQVKAAIKAQQDQQIDNASIFNVVQLMFCVDNWLARIVTKLSFMMLNADRHFWLRGSFTLILRLLRRRSNAW
jgi:hypothetical protein